MPVALTSKLPARSWYLEVESATTGNWNRVGGINSMTPAGSNTTVDATDSESDGFMEQYIIQRGGTVTFDGFFAEAADGTKDAGVERVNDAVAEVGPAANRKFRIRRPLATSSVVFDAAVDAPITMTGTGGGMTDINGFSVTLMITGKPTETTV